MADPQPLTTEDYQQLHQMSLSPDDATRAQAASLAKKLTPDEQQQFFNVQQAANKGKGEATRVDDQSPAILGTFLAGANIAKAASVPGLSVAEKALEGVKSALTQAQPVVKYQITKGFLEHLGLPPTVSMPIAYAVSGYGARPMAPTAAAPAAMPPPPPPTGLVDQFGKPMTIGSVMGGP